MELAIALEGHPDNVVPALLGGVLFGCERLD
jgi:homoserine kinase